MEPSWLAVSLVEGEGLRQAPGWGRVVSAGAAGPPGMLAAAVEELARSQLALVRAWVEAQVGDGR